MVMLHIKLTGVKNASTWSQIFLLQPPSHDPVVGINRSKFNLFQNLVIVTYQIKGITKCSNTVANILAADPLPPPLGIGSVGQIQLFHNMVMLHIKLRKRIANAATQ